MRTARQIWFFLAAGRCGVIRDENEITGKRWSGSKIGPRMRRTNLPISRSTSTPLSKISSTSRPRMNWKASIEACATRHRDALQPTRRWRRLSPNSAGNESPLHRRGARIGLPFTTLAPPLQSNGAFAPSLRVLGDGRKARLARQGAQASALLQLAVTPIESSIASPPMQWRFCISTIRRGGRGTKNNTLKKRRPHSPSGGGMRISWKCAACIA